MVYNLGKLSTNTFGSSMFSDNESLLELDYKQRDYDLFDQIFYATNECGFQFGAVFARGIVDIATAFEIGYGFTPLVIKSDGKTEEDMTKFLQGYIADHLWEILQACSTKNAYGDAFLSITLDRSLESIAPKYVTPDYYAYNNELELVDIVQYKYKKNPKTNRRVKIKVTRHFDIEKIEYTATSRELNIKPEKIPNPFGFVPIVQVSNLLASSKQFGFPEYYTSIPYMNAFHKMLMRAIEAQQYMGKPLFYIKGIPGSVAAFIKNMFGIDISTATEAEVSEAMRKFYEKFKTLILPKDAEPGFVESKYPIGEAIQMLEDAYSNICVASTTPEFLMGGNVTTAEGAAREQYGPLLGKIQQKRTYLQRPLSKLCQMILIAHGMNMDNPETQQSLPSVTPAVSFDNFVNGDLKISFIWPSVLTSDNRLKMDALLRLQAQGVLSKRTTLDNFREYVPDPEKEMLLLEEEATAAAELQQQINPQPEPGATGTPKTPTNPSGAAKSQSKKQMQQRADRVNKKGPSNVAGGA